MRPADMIFPDRINATQEARCVNPPFGCGKPVTGFRDAISAKEYGISRLCQDCQDAFFGTEDDFDDDEYPDLDMGLPPDDDFDWYTPRGDDAR